MMDKSLRRRSVAPSSQDQLGHFPLFLLPFQSGGRYPIEPGQISPNVAWVIRTDMTFPLDTSTLDNSSPA